MSDVVETVQVETSSEDVVPEEEIAAPELEVAPEEEPAPEKEEKGEEEDKKEEKPKDKKEKSEEKPADPKPKKTAAVQVGDETVHQSDLIEAFQWKRTVESQIQDFNQKVQQLSGLMDLAKSNPIAFLQSQQVDVNGIRDQLIKQAIEEETLTPEQKRIRELETQLAEREHSTEEAKKQAAAEKAQQERLAAQKALGDRLAKALEGSVFASNKDSLSSAMRGMAGILISAAKQGVKLDPSVIAQKYEVSALNDMRTVANSLEGEELANFLGKDVVKKLRKWDLAANQPKTPAPVQPPATNDKPIQTDKGPRTFIDIWDAKISR